MLDCHYSAADAKLYAAAGSHKGSVAFLGLGSTPSQCCRFGPPSALLSQGHSDTVCAALFLDLLQYHGGHQLPVRFEQTLSPVSPAWVRTLSVNCIPFHFLVSLSFQY